MKVAQWSLISIKLIKFCNIALFHVCLHSLFSRMTYQITSIEWSHPQLEAAKSLGNNAPLLVTVPFHELVVWEQLSYAAKLTQPCKNLNIGRSCSFVQSLSACGFNLALEMFISNGYFSVTVCIDLQLANFWQQCFARSFTHL